MNEPSLNAATEELRDQAQRLFTSVSQSGERLYQDGLEYLKANPLAAVGGAFVAGMVLARLASPPSRSRSSGLDDTLEELNALLRTTRKKATEAAESGMEEASSFGGKALGMIRSHIPFL